MADQKNYPGAEAPKSAVNEPIKRDESLDKPASDEPNFDHTPTEYLGSGADTAAASPISLIDETIDPAMLDEYNSAEFYHALTPATGVTPSKIEPLARSAFGSYKKEVGGTAHDGSPIGDWFKMRPVQRNGWRAIVIDVLQNIGYIRG
jgi:hypothetical protein